MKVVFVGDRPSRLNQNSDVAFVGTPSFTNLCKWIAKIEPFRVAMVNTWTHDDAVNICKFYNEGCKFVALGNNASKKLKDMKVEHFKLPHPSPKNRLLNDKDYVDLQLARCARYIRGGYL